MIESKHHYNDDWDAPEIDLAAAPAPTVPTGGSMTRHAIHAPAAPEASEVEPVAFPQRAAPERYPAIMARTSLFSARRSEGGDEERGSRVELCGQNGYRLVAWGPRLNMHDKAVLEVALEIALESGRGIGALETISLREFAQRLGVSSSGGSALSYIWRRLLRLRAVTLEFTLPSGTEGSASILSTAIRKKAENPKAQPTFHIRLNPDFLAPIYRDEKLFLIKRARREALNSQLAKWLHDFFSTHNGFQDETADDGDQATRSTRHQLARIRELSGYGGERKQFLRDLHAAMSELGKAAPELIASFKIEQKGRSSDDWTLMAKHGVEKPSYSMPEFSRSERELGAPAKAKGSAKKPAKSAPRKAGVAL